MEENSTIITKTDEDTGIVTKTTIREVKSGNNTYLFVNNKQIDPRKEMEKRLKEKENKQTIIIGLIFSIVLFTWMLLWAILHYCHVLDN